MLVVFGALLPVVLLLCLGYGARAVGGIPLIVWPALERLTYYVLIPFFLVHALGHQPPDVRTIGSLASGVLGVSMAVILVLWSVPFLRSGLGPGGLYVCFPRLCSGQYLYWPCCAIP